MVSRKLAGAVFLGLALAIPGHAQDNGTLGIELNKLEEGENGTCSAFFLFRNRTEKTLSGFEMSLAILDGDGVIDQLLTIDASPLPAARTTLKLFGIPDMKCSNISEILLHEITSCQPQNEDQMDCFPLLDMTSKAAVEMVF